MKILKLTDRVKVKIHDIEVEISPLSISQKSEIQGHMLAAAKGDMKEAMEGTKLAIQYALKSISGVEDGYELDIKENKVTDECVEELMNCEYSEEFANVCVQLLKNIPDKFIDPNTGKELKGVEVVRPKKKKAEKKKVS